MAHKSVASIGGEYSPSGRRLRADAPRYSAYSEANLNPEQSNRPAIALAYDEKYAAPLDDEPTATAYAPPPSAAAGVPAQASSPSMAGLTTAAGVAQPEQETTPAEQQLYGPSALKQGIGRRLPSFAGLQSAAAY